ncbi:MAG: SH3 domain-containing protein [Sarcina sp.]
MKKKKLALLLITATTLNIASAKIYAKDKENKNATKNQVIKSKTYKEVKEGRVINITSNLRIRENANINSKVIGYLVNDEVFEIKGKLGEWYNINVNGKTGFIHENFVKELSNKEIDIKKNNEASQKGKVINVSTNLRIREKPSNIAPIVGYLLNGQVFDIKGNYGDWKYINCDGKVGYVHKNYVKEINKEELSNEVQILEKPIIGKGKVINISSSLRIRERPKIDSSIIGYLKSGDIFDIREKNEDWTYITYNGINGHVHNAYVEELKENKPEQPSINYGDKVGKVGKVINTTTRLRVRKEANTNSSVVAYLMPDEIFSIKAQLGSWYYTQISGAEGYVSKDYVKIIKGNDELNKEDKLIGRVVNVTTGLRVRKEPSSNSNILGYLLNNEKIDINGKYGLWYKINYKGLIGYISKAYITID